MPRKYTLEKRIAQFWRKVDMSAGPDACWLWTGARDAKGYGNFWWKSRTTHAARVACEIANGPISPGMEACHLCDNPPCVNHAHLFVGTHAENVADMIAKGRKNTSDQRGEKNGNAKLTQADADNIRELYATGQYSQTQLAKQFGVVQGTIWKVITYFHWKPPA